MAEPEKKKKRRATGKRRTADEFAGVANVIRRPPREGGPRYSWSLEAIRRARDAQMQGDFARAVELAKAFRTDKALFPAIQNRSAPIVSLGTELLSGGGARGDAIRKHALECVHAPAAVLRGINTTLADHGIAVGQVVWDASDDGTEVAMRLDEWPLEHVRYDRTLRCLTTAVDGGGPRVPIVHGDGSWVVFRKSGPWPWQTDACLLPAAFIWAGHAEGMADWAGGSKAKGASKVIGKPPPGVDMTNDEGSLTPRGEAFLTTLADLMSGAEDVGVIPVGATAEFMSDTSSAWQIWKELILNEEKAAARVYQGTDAALGSVGGAPGVDIATLFGVATTVVEGDTQALADALNSGLYAVWTAVNYGDSRLAPRFRFALPDPDASAKRDESKAAWARLTDTISAMRQSGLVVGQKTVVKLCEQFGVTPVPDLQPESAPPPNGGDNFR